jgi:hypothetical protein
MGQFEALPAQDLGLSGLSRHFEPKTGQRVDVVGGREAALAQ